MSRNKEPLCAADQLMAYGVSAESAGKVQAQTDKLKAKAEALNDGGAGLCIYCHNRAALVGEGLPYCQECPHCKQCGCRIGTLFADTGLCGECAYRQDMGAMLEEQNRALNERFGAQTARGWAGARLPDFDPPEEM